MERDLVENRFYVHQFEKMVTNERLQGKWTPVPIICRQLGKIEKTEENLRERN